MPDIRTMDMFGPEINAVYWVRTTKFDTRAALLADFHYSRQKPGTGQFMPPGQTLVLVTPNYDAVFGWRRRHPALGPDMDVMSGWACTIFRNTGPILSSELVLDAERAIKSVRGDDCGPDGMYTYVDASKIRSVNPGYCFKVAGWRTCGRSKSGKIRLSKAWHLAGHSMPERCPSCNSRPSAGCDCEGP